MFEFVGYCVLFVDEELVVEEEIVEMVLATELAEVPLESLKVCKHSHVFIPTVIAFIKIVVVFSLV